LNGIKEKKERCTLKRKPTEEKAPNVRN